MSELMLIIFLSSVFAQVWVILIQPDMILDFVGPAIDKIKNEKIKHLVTCSVCMSGQLAMWIYIGIAVSRGTYNVITHVCVISVSIWLTYVINKILER